VRIVFFGTPEFAVPSLDVLRKHGYTVSAVVTAPDKPSGRGQRVIYSVVKRYATDNGIPVLQPVDLLDEKFLYGLRSLQPDLMVVVAYRILPPEVYTVPGKGAFNLHASLLPRYRGAAPIHRAIMAGERETGVTTFFLKEKVDTGNIIVQRSCPIGENETAGELHDKLAEIGAETVYETVRLIESGTVRTIPQDDSLASKAPKLTGETGHIDWGQSARSVHNLVRGLSPEPTAYSFFKSDLIKIIRTRIVDEETEETPGTVLRADEKMYVASGRGILEVIELQREGKKRMDAQSFLRGYRLAVGDVFGSRRSH
jgi:methionyl-tRNA formyltransferase